jgi:hypothetical protein
MSTPINNKRAVRPRIAPRTLLVITLIRWSGSAVFAEPEMEAVEFVEAGVEVCAVALVVELEGNAVDSVALASCCAETALNVPWDSTSKYAYAGTCNPAGIGLG